MNTDLNNIDRLIAQADLYYLLSLFLHLPTPELAAGLVDGSLAHDLKQISSELAIDASVALELLNELRGSDATALLKELRIEYTRLFTHPEQAAVGIYESLFLYKYVDEKPVHVDEKPARVPDKKGSRPILFVSEAALDAERLYKKAGLLRSEQFNESGDHLATQLEFAAFLLRQRVRILGDESAAVGARGSAGASATADPLAQNAALIEEFYARHLRKWLCPLGEALKATAEQRAYLALGHLCAARSV